MHQHFETFFEFTPREQDATLTGLTNDPNVRAHAHNLPFESTAGVGFAQADNVTQSNVQRHTDIITQVTR